jgi:hypothetical protein
VPQRLSAGVVNFHSRYLGATTFTFMAETSREQEPEPVVFFDLTLGGMQLHFLETSYAFKFLPGP